MRKWILEFLHRGFVACGFGPLVLAILYLILQKSTGVHTVTVDRLCCGIFSMSVLAFLAGGMNVVYQIERLPLMAAILIHGGVLYCAYLATYLLNDWLEWGKASVVVFSLIFLLGYLIIWAIIYGVTRRKTKILNEKLKQKQEGQ